jgi:dienelactone hydrolase
MFPMPFLRRRATWRALSAAAAASALLLCGAPPAWAQRFIAEPAAEVLAGDVLSLRLDGLSAGAEVVLQSRRTLRDWDGQRRSYRAQARYTASVQGTLDLAQSAPLPGSDYAGADLRGLFWSMKPESPQGAALPDEEVQLEARAADGSVLATQALRLRRALPSVQTRAAEPFAGAVFATLPGQDARPALILLGGSEGGSLITREAAAHASRGYAVLALPYYSPPGWSASGPTPAELPTLPAAFADIPVERLEAAREWLLRQPEVDARRIGVMGTSKGAEFALLAASRMPWIRAVVAMVPSDLVWEGWGPDVQPGQRASFAWRGEPLPFMPYAGFGQEIANMARGEARLRRPHDAGRAANPEREAAARIRVEDIRGAVMVVGGGDDQIWASGEMAQRIAATRTAAGLATTSMVFPEAGHFIGGTGWMPTTMYNAGPMKSGGVPAANARAQAAAFDGVMDFLRRSLGADAR